MRFLNYGSLNIDFVYQVDHIVQPGETITSAGLQVFPGGKGLNQSIALARAGANVYHAGMVGPDGDMLLDTCKQDGVNIQHVRTVQERSGNAIIQVSANGENSIVLFAGSNRQNTKEYIDEVFAQFTKDDVLVLQNEVNHLAYMMETAAKKDMFIALNPSPFDSILDSCPLDVVSMFLLNEVEGKQLTGETEPQKILDQMRTLYPNAKVVLTLGKQGSVYQDGDFQCQQDIFPVTTVDTTAAGDTFTGYFLTSFMQGNTPQKSLQIASMASSLAVSRQGATSSIPFKAEVEEKL